MAGYSSRSYAEERFEVENTARKTLAEIVGGIALLAGLYFTWSSLEVNREGQVTERFTKAIAQLGTVNGKGEKQLEIRLGGIYALERIARDSRRDHWPIMEVLTAYIREHAPWPPKDTPPPQNHPSPKGDPAAAQSQPPPKLATDIQAILTVLSRRDRTYEEDNQYLDLSGTDLRGAFLWRTHLEGANLFGAHLEGAYLRGAHLEGANLFGAHLEGADLRGAHLEGAILWEAHLEGADLEAAHLERTTLFQAHLERAVLKRAYLEGANLSYARLRGANFADAHLEGADLGGAELEGTINLTVTQLSTVKTLSLAHLDLSLRKEIQQQYPQLLEWRRK